MAEKNPNKLYDGIKSLQDKLNAIKELVADINRDAKELMNDANDFGGVVSRIFKEQMAKYFIPETVKIAEPVDKLIAGDRVPGSLKDLTIFLDSVPLAMIRQEPSISELASPVIPDEAVIAVPEPVGKSTNPVDELPQNISYQNMGTSDVPVEDSTVESPSEAAEVEETSFGESIKRNINESLRGGTNAFIDNFIEVMSSYFETEQDWLDFESTICSIKQDRRYSATPAAIRHYVQGGSLDVYYGDARNTLSEIYQNTEDEAKKFAKISDDKMWERYVNVMATYLPKAFKKVMGRELCSKPLNESKNSSKYHVVRCSSIGSTLPEDASGIEDHVVFEFNTKEEAEERAEFLNSGILPEEFEILGTEYKVVEA